MEDLLGQSLGPYQTIRLLGRGGMAVVYLAQDTRYGYTVALKVLPPYFRHDPAFAKRFLREVEAARVLMHPNIVRVYEAGEDKGYLYMAMEYLDDGSLQQRLEAGRPLDLAVASAVVAQVGSALDFAHARDIVHRDVKPGNILFARDGRIVLSDFGIARLRWESSLTGSGQMPGTVPYLSPEQVEGSAATALSDLWALGVVLYQMVAGWLPFSGEHEASVLYAIVHKPAPSPSLANPTLPPGVEPVILRALAKEPQARFQSGAEMAAALRQAITPRPQPALVREMPTVLAPPPAPARPPTPPGPTPVAIGPLILIMTVVVVGVFAVLLFVGIIPGLPGTPTPTPTPTPTNTPIPMRPQPATPTVAVFFYPAPILVSPDNGASVSGQVTFVWNWMGLALAANQGFEVRIWKEGQPDHYGAVSPVRATSVTFDVRSAYGVQQDGGGRYFWTVAVVQLEPYQRIGSEAAPRTLEIGIGGPGAPPPTIPLPTLAWPPPTATPIKPLPPPPPTATPTKPK